MRTIRFNAYIEIGDNKEICAIIPDVTVYGGAADNQLGCCLDEFNAAIEHTGYHFDGDDSFIPNVETDEERSWINAGEFNIISGDDWVYFDGIPLQHTGKKDDKGNEVIEGDKIKAYYFSYKPNVYEVRWNEHSLGFVCYREHENPQVKFEQLPLGTVEVMEILGNIYEK